MQTNWYLITGNLDEIMIVKTTDEKAEQLAEEFLESLEYDVYCLNGPEEALELLKSSQLDRSGQRKK
ncbi:hypothetical protein [Paenibacillus abyssi]|uniref:Uncharacterized protein n=1 Tax=Paenibacillus abyssi TaxID=1340531 RepID=A0A917G511_9BACL|nr:hypothetical protein [Paenibacillus abyssi]GGG22164.1 hypothetical protein GCM10010916_43510 [Paenibacillus abyssi]